MHISGHHTPSKPLRIALAVFQSFALCAGAVASAPSVARADVNPGGAPASTNITGTVFQDFNANGVMNTSGVWPDMAIDAGIESVSVNAFAAGSVAADATATTDANGAYTLTGLTAGALYRVEFTNLPAGFAPSAVGSSGSTSTPSNASSVQFAAAGTSNVSFGIGKDCDYCQNDPRVAINAFIHGDTTNAANWSTSAFNYFRATDRDGNPSGTNTSFGTYSPALVPPTPLASGAQTGNVFGMTWSRGTRTLFTSAYLKRGTGLGPGGPGGIYAVDADNPGTAALYVDLNSVFPGSMAPVARSFTLAGSGSTQFVIDDSLAASQVGRNAFGDLEISRDEQHLFAVNLNDRRLYRIPTSGALDSSTIISYAIPNTGLATTSGTCAANDVRPFALGKDGAGDLYVGAVCGPTSGGNAGLGVYVWRFDQTSGAFTLVLSNNPLDNYGGFSAWSDSLGTNNANWNRQVMLTDIEFDKEAMMLAFRGRNADISLPWDPSGNQTYVRSNGDLLIACPSGANFAIEPSGWCGGRASNNPGTWTYLGSSTNTYTVTEPGPSGNSFFWGDQSGDGDGESLSGALLQVPGFANVMASAFDATYTSTNGFGASCSAGNACNPNAAGVQIFSNRNGSHQGSYDVFGGMYNGTAYGNLGNDINPYVGRRNGKLAGIGDIEPMCDPAPIEIGNRVWEDVNRDGVQDADEPALAGVVVSLVTPAGVITTTTDANGNYIFKNEGATGAYSRTLRPNTAYTVTIDPAQIALRLYTLTVSDADENTDNDALSDVRDSDATLTGGLDTIAYTTGAPGENNHGLDFGYVRLPQFGDRVWIESDTDGDAATGTITPVAGMLITATNGSAVYTTMTDASGYYSFSVPAGTYTVTYGTVPAVYGPVKPSATPGGNNESGNAGSYAQSGNPDQSHVQNTTVSIADGEANWHVDFAFTPQLYDVGNRVWFDTDNDGVLDAGSESPVGGVLMQLKDVTGTVLASTTTDGNGYYSFTNLFAGEYRVTVAASNFAQGGALAGYASSNGATAPSNAASENDNDHGVDPATRAAYLANGVSSGLITLGPGLPVNEDSGAPATPNGDANANLTIDFGFYRLEVGNLIWEDYDNDGAVDAGEPGIDGVTVELRDLGGAVISTTTTSAGGYYTFTGIVSGSYVIALPASNFASAGALAGLRSSTGVNGAPAGPFEPGIAEANTLAGDSQDHGRMVGAEVRSGTVVLIPGSEPQGDAATARSQQPTIDFGLFRPASVGSLVWYDDDNDGRQDLLESGVPGVTVTLLLNGAPVSQTTTAGNGTYSFTNLISGTGYSVQFDPPVGLTFTQQLNTGNADGVADDSDVPTGVTSGTSADFTLSYGEAEPDIDAGVFLPAGLGDVMWIDLNGNGVQDNGEQPIVGATVTLLKDNGGVYEVYSTTQTVSNGYYWFADLPVGTYVVSFTLPTGYTWTQQTGALNNPLNSDVNPATGASAPVTLARGERNPNIDAGVTPYASLGNYVWVDRDQNGLQDNGAASGLNGVTVNLLDLDRQVIGSRVTANDAQGNPGYYTFTNLVSGTYYVEFVLPSGMTWTVGTPSSGNTAASEDLDNNVTDPATGQTDAIVLNWGDANPAIDAGVRPLVSLGDRVWFDADDNGQDDDGATSGIGNVTLDLYRDSDGDGVYTPGVDVFVKSTTTISTGYYTFDNLVEGAYVVVIPASNFAGGAPLNGLLSSTPTDLADNRENGDDNGEVLGALVASRAVTLTAGAESGDGDSDDTRDSSIDFGFWQPMSLGNQVWFDTNNNGLIDPSEQGVAGVSVVLWKGATPVMTTTTIAGGYYTFTNVPAGDYVIQLPASNFAAGAPLAGYRSSDPTEADPNADVDNNDNGVEDAALGVVSGLVTMTPYTEPDTDGDTDENTNWTIDFGFYKLELGNRVWVDANGNGLQDAGEAGLPNVPVMLLGSDGVTAIMSSTTDASGYYTFTGLLSGTYSVKVTAPAGMVSTVDTATSADPDNNDDADDNGVTQMADMIVSAPITLIPGAEPVVDDARAYSANPSVDFGLFAPPGLGNFVWIDVDHDGVQDAGEPGVPNVLVMLRTPTGTLTVNTDATGYYSFTNLMPGVPYTVSFAAPAGYTWTLPLAGTDRAADSNADQAGMTAPAVLGSGEFNGTIDGGLWTAPRLAVNKQSLTNGPARAGQLLTYRIVVNNPGATLARGVVISDPVPAGTAYEANSAAPAAQFSNGALVWPAFDLLPGQSYTVTMSVRVNSNLNASTVIVNVAQVRDSLQDVQVSSNLVSNPLAPTAIVLAHFGVEPEALGGMNIVWRSSAEQNTLGFHVLRSTSGRSTDAVKVSAELVVGRGASGGASYSVRDAAGQTGDSYWLQETELSGEVKLYGPVTAGAPVPAPIAVAQPVVAAPVSLAQPAVAPAVAANEQRAGQTVVQGNAVVVNPVSPAVAVAPETLPVTDVAAPQVVEQSQSAVDVVPVKAVEQPAPVQAQPRVAEHASAVSVVRGAVESSTVTSARIEAAPAVGVKTSDTAASEPQPVLPIVFGMLAGVFGVTALVVRRRRRALR
jgi:uncharacterized repeat protein (TIGR01451 family)